MTLELVQVPQDLATPVGLVYGQVDRQRAWTLLLTLSQAGQPSGLVYGLIREVVPVFLTSFPPLFFVLDWFLYF